MFNLVQFLADLLAAGKFSQKKKQTCLRRQVITDFWS